MTVTNGLLNEVAKLLNNESGNIPGYLAVSTDTSLSSIDITDTSLSGETANRYPLSGARTDNSIEFTTTRSSTEVTGASETLTATGIFSGDATEDLMAGIILPNITHTTNYDIEFIFNLNVGRQ